MTELPLDSFLALYALFIIVLLYAWWRRRRDDLRAVTSPALQARLRAFDSYEIAYLRGGVREVARVAVVSLVLRGHLRLAEGICHSHLDRTALGTTTTLSDRVDATVLDWCATPQPAWTVSCGAIDRRLWPVTLPYREQLLAEGLLAPEDARSRWQRTAGVVLMFVGVTGALLGDSLIRRNRVDTLLLCVVAGLVGIGLLFAAPRIGHRGRYLLRKLRVLQKRGAVVTAPTQPTDAIVAAVFGIRALSRAEFLVLEDQD